LEVGRGAEGRNQVPHYHADIISRPSQWYGRKKRGGGRAEKKKGKVYREKGEAKARKGEDRQGREKGKREYGKNLTSISGGGS